MDFMKKITELSKKVGDAATDTYNTVADKSGKLIEDAKLKISISDKENDIDEIYMIMGKTVYDAYKQGEDVGKVFAIEAKKVDKILSEIEDMKVKMLYNKGLRVCSNCGETIGKDSVYCSNCGSKQKAMKVKEEKETKKEEAKEEPISKVCPQCGLVSDNQAKFCTKCGYKYEK